MNNGEYDKDDKWASLIFNKKLESDMITEWI